MLVCEDGYREAMVGTVSLYDGEGVRQHTIYLGAAPEYGKKSFLKRLEREIKRACVALSRGQVCRNSRWSGIKLAVFRSVHRRPNT